VRKSSQLDDGPIMIIVFGCLAVTLSFISFGLGFINLAKAKAETDKLPPITVVERPEDLQATDRAKAEVLALRRELEQVTAQIARAKESRQSESPEPSGLRDQLASLQNRATELQTQIAAKETRLTDLNGQLAGKEGATREAEFRAADLKRQVEASGDTIKGLKSAIEDAKKIDVTKLGGSMKNPQYIECIDGEIVLQPQGEHITIKAIKGSDSKFVAAVRKHEVFFLVRPAGFKSFDAALAAAENLGATVGYEPVDADLSSIWSKIKFK
jgi:predicted RNase H-like nuclease (RuvC/YqgF family)